MNMLLHGPLLARGCQLGSTKLLAQGWLGACWFWIIPAHPPAAIPQSPLDFYPENLLCWGWSHPLASGV